MLEKERGVRRTFPSAFILLFFEQWKGVTPDEHPRMQHIHHTDKNTHTQDHTHKQRDYSHYPNSHTLLYCISSICDVHNGPELFFFFFFDEVELCCFTKFPATSHIQLYFFGETLAATSISHLNLRLNCWQWGCTVGKADFRFWPRRKMHRINKTLSLVLLHWFWTLYLKLFTMTLL